MKTPFEKLPLDDKAELVWEHGQYIDSIEYYGYKLNLYSMGTSFIEVFYSPSNNDVEKIQEVDKEGLNKYANRINIV